MAEIGISVAAKVVEYLVDPVLRHGKYLFCAGKISRNVESTKEKLKSTWESVQKRVEEAHNRAEIVEETVQNWLNLVKSVMEEVEKLEQEMRKGCSFCRGWRPTLKGYHLSRQLSKKTIIMAELTQNSEFNPFSHPAPIPDIDYFSSRDFMYFNSTRLASQQLLWALQDDNVYMIGLYGMGGSGKTTLVKEVGKKAKESKLFERVAFTTVSQKVDVRKIQGEIADMLDLKFAKEQDPGRARELSLRLQSRGRILVILDDVWSKLNLEDIGIPLDGRHKGYKVLLTTRRKQVCTLMDCQIKIPLNLLSEEEAWNLFQQKAYMADDMSARLLNGVAQEVARECKGLPIAIVAVATSLKGKSFDDWKVALHNLRVSKPMDVDEGERDAYSCLRLSYDYLRNEQAKFLFLMCSMFPEDHDIPIEELYRYGMGLGICKGVESFEMERSNMNVAIQDLIDSSLLMSADKFFWPVSPLSSQKCNTRKFLKMHDMFRDVALWIASKERGTIMVDPTKDLNALSKDGSMKDFYAVSLWRNNMYPFPEQLDSPNLAFILINSRHQLDLSYASLEGIKELKVMAVINNFYEFRRGCVVLPQSTQCFNNLQTLRLVGQEIDDISFVVSLRRLMILDLQHSKFNSLPTGLENLDELKLLDLSFCTIEKDCYEVIGKCSQLEELYLWEDATFPYELFWNDAAFLKLQRYRLRIGNFYSRRQRTISSMKYRLLQFRDLFSRLRRPISNMNVLYLGGLNLSNSGASIKFLLRRADFAWLEGLEGCCKTVIPEMVQTVGGMKELNTLNLHSTSAIEYIIDTTTLDDDNSFRVDALFPMLVRLELSKVDNLKIVCHGPPLLCILEKLESLDISECSQLNRIFSGAWKLCNLKSLKIYNCVNLTALFPMSVAQSLVLLQDIEIVLCSELKQIIIEEGQIEIDAIEGEIFPNLKNFSVRNCGKLEYIFPGECNLCNLKTLNIDSCGLSTSLFSISVVRTLLTLEDVTIANCDELQCVFGEQKFDYGSSYQDKIEIVLPVLQRLRLRNLSKLVNVCPENIHLRWPSLMELSCTDCIKLTTLCKFNMMGSELRSLHSNMGSDAAIANVSQSSNEVSAQCEKLERLKLKNLFELSFIWMDSPQILSPRFLKELEVTGCKRVKFIFSTAISKSLLELTALVISNCEELEKIIEENEEAQNLSNSQPCFPKLVSLEVVLCDKLKCLFSLSTSIMLPKLVDLKISGAAQLEHAFKCRNEVGTESMEKIMLPNLRRVELKQLPNFVGISQGLKLHELKLHWIVVYECPKFAPILADKIPLHPWRTEVPLVTADGQVSNEGTSYIQHASTTEGEQKKIMTSCVRSLVLMNLPDLMFIWKAPTLISFQNLESLKVVGCSKLTCIFSDAIITSVPQLKYLNIEDCEALEEIISSSAHGGECHCEISPKSCSQQVCFRRLERVWIKRCNKMKFLFPFSVAKHLQRLQSLKITEVPQLEYVFSCVKENHGRDRDDATKFPNLTELLIPKVPRFNCIVCEGLQSQLQFPVLKRGIPSPLTAFTPSS